MSFMVKDLIEGCPLPLCVNPTDAVQDALAKMIANDYSQLPVVKDDLVPEGLVTSDSILRALRHFGVTVEELRVADAMTRAIIRHDEDDLFEMLDALRDHYAVLIVDGEDKLIGIVTSYDTTEYFRRRAEDMMLVEDIEVGIKEHIEAAFTDPSSGEVDGPALDAVANEITDQTRALHGRFRQALRKYLELQGEGKARLDADKVKETFSLLADKAPPRAFQDLTFNDYVELLLHKRCAAYYDRVFDLQAKAARNLLDSVRRTRNDLAHFRGEISPEQREQLRFCVAWLERHPVSIPVDWPSYQVQETGEPAVVRESTVDYVTSAGDSDPIVPPEEELGPSDSRYAPLAIWLQSRPPTQDRVALTFEEVEKIIGGELPNSAHRHNAWWANDTVSHTWSREWLDAGWRKAQVNLSEETVFFVRIGSTERAYLEFFTALQADLRDQTEVLLKDLSPRGQSWLTVASLPQGGPQSIYFGFAFIRARRFRVELYIDTGDQAKNKRIFDRLYADRDTLEAAIDAELSWERLNHRRASRVGLYRPGSIADDPETLSSLRAWAVDAMPRFYQVFAGPAERALFDAEKTGS